MEGCSEDSCSEPCYSPGSLRLVKERLSVAFMRELHKAFFNEVAQARFMKPKPVGVTAKPLQSSKTSTTEGSGDFMESKPLREPVEEWKINIMTAVFISFEERCLLDRVLDDDSLRVFRSQNRGLLGRVLEHMYAFRGQKYVSLACSILMVNAAKIKIPKEKFNKLLETTEMLKQSGLTNVCAIKRSKAFSLLRSVLKV